MTPSHTYRATIRWTGNLGVGTREYGAYSRDLSIGVGDRPPILASSGLSPRGDPSRYNPEELVLGALSSCHMLWYLHLCSEAGVVVDSYIDEAEAVLQVAPDGGGRIVRAVLRPRVVVREGVLETAVRLHEEAHRKCFIAQSVAFPVDCEPVVERAVDA